MGEKIEIAVCYHKPSIVFESDALKPMQLGKASARIDLGFRGDNTGDNISAKNRYYAEDTAFYWLWKNSRADVKGIMHYRRLLNLSSPGGNEKSIVIDDIKSPEQFVSDLGLDSGNILKILETNDVIVQQKRNTRIDWPDADINMEQLYKISHIPEYLDYTMEIIEHYFPDIYQPAKRILAGNTGHFFNICVMKTKYFDSLCEFKFGVLTRLEKMIDVSRPEIADGWRHTGRYLGFIGERLTMFFIEYLRESRVKIAEYPVVTIAPRGISAWDAAAYGENACADKGTKPEKTITPVFGKDAVAIMFATNNGYVPSCGVMLQSIIENANSSKNYDIIIAESRLEERNKKFLEAMTKENISIRVINILEYIDKEYLKSFTIRAHFSVETYYRFFIPQLFGKYDKIVYLDCDMVVLRDIAELYAEDIGDNWWGVTHAKSISMFGFMPKYWECNNFIPYIKNTLKMDSPFDYFQSGVMIWNVRQCIKDNVFDKLIERLAEIGKPHYVDQDVMSSVANGKKIFWISDYWNVLWFYSFFPQLKGKFAYDTVMHNLENPFIIHYASDVKPWNEPNRPNAHYFWRYARNTPFYEMLLKNLMIPQSKVNELENRMVENQSKLNELKNKMVENHSKINELENKMVENQSNLVNVRNHIQEASVEEIKISKPAKIKITPRKIVKYLLPHGFVRFYQIWMKK